MPPMIISRTVQSVRHRSLLREILHFGLQWDASATAGIWSFVVERLSSIAAAVPPAALTVVAFRLGLIALFLASSARVASGFGAIAEVTLAFAR